MTSNLVSRLVQEAIKKPEKLEAHRKRIRTDEEQRDAVEDVATRMLAANKPITSAKYVHDEVQ